MFYTDILLGGRNKSSKNAPKLSPVASTSFARAWLAAHFERKLTKSQFLQTNISTTVNSIVGDGNSNVEPIALRFSGQLLLGVVRIFARKARYLLEDCNEAILKIKMAFKPGDVDMPSDNIVASAAAINLTDNITEFDVLVPDPALDPRLLIPGDEPETVGVQNVSRAQDITLTDGSLFSFASQSLSRSSFNLEAEDILMSSAQDDTAANDEWNLNLGFGFDDEQGPSKSDDRNNRHSSIDIEIGRREDIRVDEGPSSPRLFDARTSLSLGQESVPERKISIVGDIEMEDTSLREVELQRDELRDEFMDIDEDIGGGRNSMGLMFPEVIDPLAPPNVFSVPDESEQLIIEGVFDLERPQKQKRKRVPRPSGAALDLEIELSADIIQNQLANTSDILRPSFQFANPFEKVEPYSRIPAMLQKLCEDRRKGKVDFFLKRRVDLEEVRAVPEVGQDDTHIHDDQQVIYQYQPEDENSKNTRESSVPGIDDQIGMGESLSFDDNEDAEAESKKRKKRSKKDLISGPNEEELDQVANFEEIIEDFQEEYFDDEQKVQEESEESVEGFGKGFSKSTVRAIGLLKENFANNNQKELLFDNLMGKSNRSETVRMFFELLVLKTRNMINVNQEKPFSDIKISAMPALFSTDIEAS
ncbi:sister chromatid cohesion protein 1 [Nowakowskiella sp. JEL0078]|nr:sister chromatid cohesion protein 1 [Nowakowskiella sp. JEL0078]